MRNHCIGIHVQGPRTCRAARGDRSHGLVRRHFQTAHEDADVVHALQREQRRPLLAGFAWGARLWCSRGSGTSAACQDQRRSDELFPALN